MYWMPDSPEFDEGWMLDTRYGMLDTGYWMDDTKSYNLISLLVSQLSIFLTCGHEPYCQ